MARTGVVDSSDPQGPLLPDLQLSRSRHDRRSEIRMDGAALLRLLLPESTDVVIVAGGRRGATVPLTDDGARLALLPATAVPEFGAAVAALTAPPAGPGVDGVPAFDADRDPVAVLLGTVDGRAVIALVLPPANGPEVPDHLSRRVPQAQWAGLRDIGASLPDADVGLAVEAIGLANWHRVHPRCSICGVATVPAAAGHERRCPADGSAHHPRSDPAVIMMILDADDRLLLARQAVWPERRYSLLAGFVEPGESLEAAVVRETREESGIEVPPATVRYLASQPWPFPASLMVGFVARAATTDIHVDGEEIVEAMWVSRDELKAALADGSMGVPPPISIARQMIERWAGEPLVDEGSWR